MRRVESPLRRVAEQIGGAEPARRSAAVRRRSHALRPMTEHLEGRTLLSLGLDPTWGFGGEAALMVPLNTAMTTYSESISSIAMQNTRVGGQVVAVGTLTTNTTPSGSTTTTTTVNLIVARFNVTGSVDTSFGTNGTETIPLTGGGVTYDDVQADDIAVQASGTIDILATVTPTSPSSSSSEFLVVQLTPDGAIDPSFGTSGFQFLSFASSSSTTLSANATALAIGPDGKLVAVGDVDTSTGGQVFGIARLNTDGTLDTSFNGTGTQTVAFNLGGSSSSNMDYADGVVVQPDASIVVVGQASLPATGGNTTPLSDADVARLTAAGTLDTSFNGTGELTYSYNLGGNSDDSAAGVALDGTQIAIVGTTAQVSTSSSSTVPLAYDLTVTMLNSNGTFATSFNGNGRYRLFYSSSGLDTTAVSVLVRPSGSLLIGANESGQNVGELTLGLLLSLTSAGAPDTTSLVGTMPMVPASVASRLLLQPDGKILFRTGNAVTRTTAPPPAITATSIITTGTGKKTQATGVTITFNTAVNGTMAINPKSYQVLRATEGRPSSSSSMTASATTWSLRP